MMNKEKQERLKELLENKDRLSDQELEELELLQMEYNDEDKQAKPIIMPEEIPKPRKRSLIEIIIQKLKKKPITWEDIEKLKNERTIAYLKRDIAKANHERKNLGHRVSKESSPRKKSKIVSQSQRGSSDGGLRKMIGSNGSRNYKDLIG